MAKVYLEVDFRQKDIVKALGARFDGVQKKWFVNESERERFLRWIPKEDQASKDLKSEIIETPVVNIGRFENKKNLGTPLSVLLFEVSDVIRRAYPFSRWVKAEVSNIKTYPNGHTYIELIEHNSEGREIAKASAKLWAGNKKILKRFEEETGGSISIGMVVVFEVNIEFSHQYGLSLIIENIDTSWFLGEMEKKLIEIRGHLKKLGIYENNKVQMIPEFIHEVIVVSPENAAGLGDFRVEAEKLEASGLCKFQWVSATFEGLKALESFKQAQLKVEKIAESFGQMIVIIRGGGAKSALNWLNELEIAKWICELKIPVLTGIGHEQDKTILDEVACISRDTPSKAIEWIKSKILWKLLEAKEIWEQIKKKAFKSVNDQKARVNEEYDRCKIYAKKNLTEKRKGLDMALKEVEESSRGKIRESKSQIEALMRLALSLNPDQVLKRGFVIVRDENGNVVKSKNNASASLTIQWSDGVLKVKGV